MKRAEKSRDLKNNILNVSRELFITKGYKATTIRHITEKAGITIGSLYHFYRDKEDLFSHIVIDNFREIVQVSDNLLGAEADGILKYAFRFALEMKVIDLSEIVAELYLEAHMSWRIMSSLITLFLPFGRTIFDPYNEHFTDQDYYLRFIAIRGARMNFMIERLHQNMFDYHVKCPFMIETALSLFNVPPNIITPTVRQAMRLINEKDIEMYGYKIAGT